jgi:hypothetical protein
MKKITIMLVLLAFASTTFAAVKALEGYTDTATYYQFTRDPVSNTGDYINYSRTEPGQTQLAAQMIYLHVDYESDVWVSNYIRSWEENIVALDENVYQMGAKQYGAFEVDGEKVWEGTGESRTVTYNKVINGREYTNTTQAYYVGHFNGGETVALYMTTLESDGGETVDSQQYVNGWKHEDTTLASRVDGTHDVADNVRINFGLTTYPDGREFVAFGVGGENPPAPSGQPLPGVLTSCLVALGATGIAARRRKHSKK